MTSPPSALISLPVSGDLPAFGDDELALGGHQPALAVIGPFPR
ncbi:hypothetical protein [Actinoplanes cyaneus]|nr:hypothetical protein [Actinoplanes cyaneus]